MPAANASLPLVGLVAENRMRVNALLSKWIKQGQPCAYCDSLASTIDHVVPLSRGGTHYEGNLAPACRSCNSRKHRRFIAEWMLARA